MAESVAFLPWVLNAVVARASAPGATGVRRRVALDVDIVANGTVKAGAGRALAIDLLGAGDVVALLPAMIAAIEPSPGARAVEPNYFPYVDFVDADFPWRYSLDVAGGRRRRPWLVLLALEPDEFEFLGARGGPLGRILVKRPDASLPDLAQSWAWAHAQVDVSGLANPHDLAALGAYVTAQPGRHHARLLCPRRLRDNALYHLFLVPAFEAGRIAGLGRAEAASPWNAAAWTTALTTPLDLPYYRTSSFQTSTLEDFESLVRRLRPLATTAPTPVGGSRAVFVGQPGYYDDFVQPTITAAVEGALQHPHFVRAVDFVERTALTPRLETTLTQVVQSAEAAERPDAPLDEDPLIALPVYGRHYARPPAVSATASQDPWIHQVNLDPRLRLAGGVGARIVKRHQEEFLRVCWQQVGAILEANRLRARLHMADVVGARLLARHFTPLPVETAMRLGGRLFDLVPAPARPSKSIATDLQERGVPAGSVDVALLRVAAKRPVRQRSAAGAGRQAATVVRPEVGILGVGAVAARPARRTVAAARAEATRLRDVALRTARTTGLVPPELAPDARARGLMRPEVTVARVEADDVLGAVADFVRAIPLRKASDLVRGLQPAEATTFEPVLRAPRIAEGLARFVPEEARDFLLPNSGGLEDNTATLMIENRAFIEALVVGANHEMNRELRWREFPTDMRGTIFGRFWSRSASVDDATADDVRPVADWHGAIGSHFRGGGKPRIVLVLRGDLVRRYPGLLVALNQQTIPSGGRWKADRGTTMSPLFTNRFGDDTLGVGFDATVADLRAAIRTFYFVLLEPTGRFRFGLDVATVAVRAERLALDAAPRPFPIASLEPSARGVRIRDTVGFWMKPRPGPPATAVSPDQLSWRHVGLQPSGYVDFDRLIAFADGSDLWGPNRDSASLARATLQKPVCAVLPAQRLVG